jgi:hypothetical protein
VAGDREKFIAHLEELGEEEVKARLIRGSYGHAGDVYSRVDFWLQSKADARKEDREAMSLSISRKALFNSRMATIIAAIAIIIAASDKLITLFQWVKTKF